MKKLLTVLLLILTTSITAQMYVNLQAGTAENDVTTNATLTYQVGLRYQISQVGLKMSFNQTDGLFHAFDSYVISGVYEIIEPVYFSMGYRYDNGRGWYDNRNGFNVGVNGLIPLTDLVKIHISVDTTFNDIIITNIMAGLELKLIPSKNSKHRFF